MATESTTISEAHAQAERRVAQLKGEVDDLEKILRKKTEALREARLESTVLARLLGHRPDGGDDRRSHVNTSGDDWGNLSRTGVVRSAVAAIAATHGVATPTLIEEYLEERNRDDSTDQIGAALAYLNKKGLVRNVGRGKWVAAGQEDL